LKPVILDTGVIVALLDRSERFHPDCAEAIGALTLPLITCEAVIAESCYLLRNLRGAPERILDNVGAGIFQIPFHLPDSSRDVQRAMRQYRDRGIDFADACLIALASEFGTGDILTLDRDFHIYRWGRKNPFRLLIALD
jgi:predicted nucleic acid-binding protein